MASNESLLSFNQSCTHIVYHDDARRSLTRYVSIFDDTVTPFEIHLPGIQQIEPYLFSNILFVRTTCGLCVWNVTTKSLVGEYKFPNILQIVVSKKYVALCRKHEITLLSTSTLSFFQTFTIKSSYRVGTCAVEYYDNRTVFAYSNSQGNCTICRENTLLTMSVFQSDIIAICLNCANDAIIIACSKEIKIICLSSLNIIRRAENKIGSIHVISLSKTTCYCSNRNGYTQCISLQKNHQDISIDHAAGVYVHSHGMLCYISMNGHILRRICVE